MHHFLSILLVYMARKRTMHFGERTEKNCIYPQGYISYWSCGLVPDCTLSLYGIFQVRMTFTFHFSVYVMPYFIEGLWQGSARLSVSTTLRDETSESLVSVSVSSLKNLHIPGSRPGLGLVFSLHTGCCSNLVPL